MNKIQTVARLYDIRDAARKLLGAEYAARMSDLGGAIKMSAANRLDKDVLLAATDLCTTNNLQGMDLCFVMAAAVELIEPGEPEQAAA